MGGGLLSHNLIIDRQIETSSLSLSSFMGSVFLVRISLIIYNISAICSLKILSRHENEDTRCGTLSLTHCLGASLLSGAPARSYQRSLTISSSISFGKS